MQGWDYCYFQGGSGLDNGVGQLDGDGGGGGGVVGILGGLAEGGRVVVYIAACYVPTISTKIPDWVADS